MHLQESSHNKIYVYKDLGFLKKQESDLQDVLPQKVFNHGGVTVVPGYNILTGSYICFRGVQTHRRSIMAETACKNSRIGTHHIYLYCYCCCKLILKETWNTHIVKFVQDSYNLCSCNPYTV